MDDIFLNNLPNHELYGYGALRVGDMCDVDLMMHDKTPSEIQRCVHSYGQLKKKKFKTKVLNGILYIKRIK